MSKVFTGRSWEWGKGGGSTGENHPFRQKSRKAFKAFEKRVAEEAALNAKVLESFGIEAQLERDMGLELPLEELDRFVEANGLEHRGIDVVFERFERARYDHDEYGEEE